MASVSSSVRRSAAAGINIDIAPAAVMAPAGLTSTLVATPALTHCLADVADAARALGQQDSHVLRHLRCIRKLPTAWHTPTLQPATLFSLLHRHSQVSERLWTEGRLEARVGFRNILQTLGSCAWQDFGCTCCTGRYRALAKAVTLASEAVQYMSIVLTVLSLVSRVLLTAQGVWALFFFLPHRQSNSTLPFIDIRINNHPCNNRPWAQLW